MGIPVSLDEALVKSAKSFSMVQSRSVPKQIEHWAKIGRIVEENPGLDYNSIKAILLGLEDAKQGNIEPYRPGNL